jgi:hypothetical protein
MTSLKMQRYTLLYLATITGVMVMRTFLFGMAYFLIFTTPIGVGVTLLIYWIIFSTDQTITSLSMHLFLQENVNFLPVTCCQGNSNAN